MIGKVFSHYRVLKHLGEWGMGVIYDIDESDDGQMFISMEYINWRNRSELRGKS
jgi:hypothetical protein